MTRICYGYGRASTDKQHLTEEVQFESIKKQFEDRFKSQGYTLGEYHYDAATSGNKHFTDRPSGLRLWMILRPGDVIITAHSDRAFRNTADGLHTTALIRQRGCQIVMPDIPYDVSTGDGEFMATIQFALNARERRRCGERISATMKSQSSKGARYGGRKQSSPIGWRDNGSGITPDADERSRVDQIAALRAGGASFDRLELILNQPPYCWRRARGQVWSRKTIRLALEARRLGYPKVYLYGRERRSAAGRATLAHAP